MNNRVCAQPAYLPYLVTNRKYDHFHKGNTEEVWPIFESKHSSNTIDQDIVRSFLKPCMNEEKSELLTKVAVSDNNDSIFLGREQNYPTMFTSMLTLLLLTLN